MDVCIYTLGCKVNQYESGVIVAKLKKAGYNAFEGLKFADVYVLNTCAVTSEAEKKSRQAISKMTKLNPDCKIFVVGCASQNNTVQFEKYKNVKLIKGVASKTDIVALLESHGVKVDELPSQYEHTEFAEVSKTRQTIKIQDGCNNFCSYCLIPYLRGRNRSRSVEDILREVNECKGKVKEVVLTGIDISSYGKDIGTNLGQLVQALKDADMRLRLGSLEVSVIDDGFLQKLADNKNFCPHFHLSLQSGSDRVLQKMNRKYTTAEYLSKVQLIRKYFPDAGITTDIIVGFPTETEQTFAESMAFAEEVAFSDIHIFPYSVRKGTVAETMPQVADDVKKDRVVKMTEVKLRLKENFLRQYVGKTVEILAEEINCGHIAGYTKNYIKVYVDKSQVEENDFCNVKITGLFNDGLIGEVIKL